MNCCVLYKTNAMPPTMNPRERRKSGEMCRCCMSRKKNMKCVLSDKQRKTIEKIAFCTGLHISKNDGLPTKVCKACFAALDIAYKFKTDCLHTDKMLRGIYVKPDDNIKKEHKDEVDIKQCMEQEDKAVKEESLSNEIKIKIEHVGDESVDYKYSDHFPTDDDDEPSENDNLSNNDSCIGEALNEVVCDSDYPFGKDVLIPVKPSKEMLAKNIVQKLPAGICVKKLGESTKIKEIRPKKLKTTILIPAQSVKPKTKVKRKPLTKEEKEKRLLLRLYCSECEIQFNDMKELGKHKRAKHQPREIVCEVCGDKFAFHCTYLVHLKKHGPPTLKCQYCDYATYIQTDLERHIFVHEGIKNYVCEFCPKAFHTSSNLKWHVKSRHLGTLEKNKVCPTCGYRTDSAKRLERHMDTHLDIKRFECEHCHSRFRRRELWKKHMESVHKVMVPKLRPGRQKKFSLSNEYGTTLQASGTMPTTEVANSSLANVAVANSTSTFEVTNPSAAFEVTNSNSTFETANRSSTFEKTTSSTFEGANPSSTTVELTNSS